MKKRIDFTQDMIESIGIQSTELSEWITEIEPLKSKKRETKIPIQLIVLTSLSSVVPIIYDWEIPLGMCWRGGCVT